MHYRRNPYTVHDSMILLELFRKVSCHFDVLEQYYQIDTVYVDFQKTFDITFRSECDVGFNGI